MTLLQGVRVLDAAHGVSGPFAAQLLRWLGADVSRLRLPGDWLHELDTGPSSQGRCLRDYIDEGKTVVDDDVRELVGMHDVLVVNWTPARWAALGLDAELVRQVNPHLVIVCVTGFGQDGPDADRPAAEVTTYHAAGEGYQLPGGDIFRAYPTRPPVRGGRFLADFDTGLAAAAGAMGALVRRDAGGPGDLVDVAALEVEIGNNRTTLGRAFHENVDFDRSYAGYDYAGVLECTDGWICLRPSEERHWQQLCAVIGRAELADDPRFATRHARFENNDELNTVLRAWAADRTQAEVRQALLDAGCPGGPYLAPERILDDAAIGSRGLIGEVSSGGRAPIGLLHERSELGDAADALRDRLARGTGPGPLAGLRVLDLTWVAAGPYATELLAFLGADVFKIESRTVPDLFRRSLADPGADLDGSVRFADLNQGKRSVALNLRTERGRELALDLAAQCDVVVENYRPGVRDRLGLSDAALHERNPALVVVALSGFGASAVDRDRPGYASIFSAESGISALTGYPDAPPTDIRDSNDLRTGTAGALAVLSGVRAALNGRKRVSVDASARDTLVALQGDALLQASRGGSAHRAGNTMADAVPYDCYRADDAWVAIAVRTAAEWRAFAGVVAEFEDAVNDQAERVRRRDEIDKIVAAWCTGRRSADVVRDLVAAGVPAAASAAASAIRDDPHLHARCFFRPAEHPVLGELLLIGCPLRYRVSGTVQGRRPPLLGEHSAAAFDELLGIGADEFGGLVTDQVVW